MKKFCVVSTGLMLAVFLLSICLLPVQAAVIYVKQNATSGNGSSWGNALPTVQAGVNAAYQAGGGQVWVAAGTYHECIDMKAGVELYGGFVGKETSLGGRPSFPRVSTDLNATILDGCTADGVSYEKSVVSIVGTSSSDMLLGVIVDGFTIQNGKGFHSGSSWNGGGIRCLYSSPIIRNNSIIANGVLDALSTNNSGGGIHCTYSPAVIAKNTIIGNSAVQGGGIYCAYCSPVITGNVINMNISKQYGGGIYGYRTPAIILSGNHIEHNNAAYAAAVYWNDSAGVSCKDNVITKNTASSSIGGILLLSVDGSVSNNTIADNGTYGLFITNSKLVALANNIIAYNGYGIYSNTDLSLSHNCVFGNTGFNYSILILAHTSDIYVDPVFVDRSHEDYHILSASPCRNTGTDNVVQNGDTDIDGKARIYGLRVDIGADEVYSLSAPLISLTRDSKTFVQHISMTAPNGGDISYTTDSNSKSISYASPLLISNTTTYKAHASKPGYNDSGTSSATFTKVGTPIFDAGTRLGDSVNVTISSATSGAAIYYTTDGTIPCADPTNPHILSGSSVALDADSVCTLKAIATLDKMVDSSLATSEKYNLGNIYYVSTSGNDVSCDGLSWGHPFKTLTNALTKAVSGDQIWVAKGTYNERISVNKDVELYGGFVGTETSLSVRPVRSIQNATILDSGQTGTVVTISGSSSKPTVVIDGFYIQNGKATYGGGVHCTHASVTIRNNSIQGNFTSSTGLGGGVYCEGESTFILENNIIIGNTCGYGGGVCCGNTVSSNPMALTIKNNLIVNNTANIDGGGIYCAISGLPSLIANNTIAYNTAPDTATLQKAGGVRIKLSGTLYVTNNIIAYNKGFGISNDSVTNDLRLFQNCVWNDSLGDGYCVYGDGHRIALDPKFTGVSSGDFSIQSDSPCKDAGWCWVENPDGSMVSFVDDADTDLAGQARVENGRVDIGAYESYQAAIPQFSIRGGVYRAEQILAMSTKTSGATIHYTTNGTLPTASSAIYTTPIHLYNGDSVTIQAIAVKSGLADSKLYSAVYTIASSPSTSQETDSETLRSVRLNTYNNFDGYRNYWGWSDDKLIDILASKQSLQISEGWSPSLIAAVQARNTDTKVYVYYTLHEKLSGDRDGDTPGLASNQSSSPLSRALIDPDNDAGTNDWWLRDGNGSIVYESGNSGSSWSRYLDVGKTGFKETYLASLKSRLNYYNDLVKCCGGRGIDGIILDYWNTGLRCSSIKYLTSTDDQGNYLHPLPAAYQCDGNDKDILWRQNAWLPYISYITSHIHTDSDVQFGRTIIGNCAGVYGSSIPGQTTQRGYIDGTIYELWIKGSDGWFSDSSMTTYVDAFLNDDKEAWAADYHVTRGVDSSGYPVNPAPASFDGEMRLSLAMYYIALPITHKPVTVSENDHNAYQEMRSYNHADKGATWDPIWNFRIGEPVDAKYSKQGYLWIRKYTRGLVLANYGNNPYVNGVRQDQSVSCTYALDPNITYWEWNQSTQVCERRSGTLTIAPHTARILSTFDQTESMLVDNP